MQISKQKIVAAFDEVCEIEGDMVTLNNVDLTHEVVERMHQTLLLYPSVEAKHGVLPYKDFIDWEYVA